MGNRKIGAPTAGRPVRNCYEEETRKESRGSLNGQREVLTAMLMLLTDGLSILPSNSSI